MDFLCVFGLHDTRRQYLVMSEGFICLQVFSINTSADTCSFFITENLFHHG